MDQTKTEGGQLDGSHSRSPERHVLSAAAAAGHCRLVQAFRNPLERGRTPLGSASADAAGGVRPPSASVEAAVPWVEAEVASVQAEAASVQVPPVEAMVPLVEMAAVLVEAEVPSVDAAVASMEAQVASILHPVDAGAKSVWARRWTHITAGRWVLYVGCCCQEEGCFNTEQLTSLKRLLAY